MAYVRRACTNTAPAGAGTKEQKLQATEVSG